jgi:hypothetical protein
MQCTGKPDWPCAQPNAGAPERTMQKDTVDSRGESPAHYIRTLNVL